MPPDTMGSRGAIAPSAILLFGVFYLWLFTGDASRGWFLYLVTIYPLLVGYWLTQFYRWLMKATAS